MGKSSSILCELQEFILFQMSTILFYNPHRRDRFAQFSIDALPNQASVLHFFCRPIFTISGQWLASNGSVVDSRVPNLVIIWKQLTIIDFLPVPPNLQQNIPGH